MNTAFIIMPFGKTPGQQQRWKEIYEYLVKPILRECGLEPLRADEIGQPGNIAKDIIQLLWRADVVVADLTSCNPNVFYELGIRHALHKHGTVLICKKGEKLPFDISNYKVLFYSTELGAAERFKSALKSRIEAAVSASQSDNPVFDFLSDEIGVVEEKLTKTQIQLAQLQDSVQIILHRLVRSFGNEILLAVSDDLIHLFGSSGTMLDRIAKIRFELALEATVLLPSVRVVNHSGLDSNSIQIFIGDATIKDHFLPNYCYAVGDVTGYEDCISSATTDPITGERAFLVEVTKATKIKGNRVHLIYPEDVLEFSLKTTFRRYLRELEVLMAQQRPEEVVTESKESEDDEG